MSSIENTPGPRPDFEPARLPANEAARVERVHRSGVMDVRQENRYAMYVDLAKMIADCPVAYTGLLDEDRQFFLAKDFDGRICADEIARPSTLCQYALSSTQPMIVPDLRLHPKLKHNPFVVSEPNWVFWAGYPLVTEDGLVLGTLCTVDYVPRSMEPEQITRMQQLANNLALLLKLQMEERDAITERMADLAAHFHRTQPDLQPAELDAFLCLCSAKPVNQDHLGRLCQWDLVEVKDGKPQLTAAARGIQAEHGLFSATYRHKLRTQKTVTEIDDLFAAMT